MLTLDPELLAQPPEVHIEHLPGIDLQCIGDLAKLDDVDTSVFGLQSIGKREVVSKHL